MTLVAEERSQIQRGAIRPRAACLWLPGVLLVVLLIQPAASQSIDGKLRVGLCASICNPDVPAMNDVAGMFDVRVFQAGLHGWGSSEQQVDRSVLLWINGRSNPLFAATMKFADHSFYPVVFGSVPAYWAATVMSDDVPTSDALAFSIGWVATAGSTIILKRLIGRDRPFASDAFSGQDLIIRYSPAKLAKLGSSASMPSGHASMSVFAASFLAMEIDSPASYAAGGVWATSVAVSRIWNGVHFPSDIAAGTILGIGAALLVRQFD